MPPPRPAPPRSTYRLQLHGGFTFADATAIVPYLAALGISHVYCSPYFRARPGSTHGYDVVDHNAFNPEIGTREDFEWFVATLRAHGMGHIADFVPNHVGIMGADNPRWLDVLENGPASPYADHFDIDWQPADPALSGKVLVPVLGDSYGAVLERGELELRYEEPSDSFAVYYHEHRLPINRRDHALARQTLASYSPDALHELLERQAYRLAHWRVASDEVNYRRFFDVNDLAALRMENETVFTTTHRLLFELLETGKVDGIRIDHPDGLFDPAQYFQRLHTRAAPYVWAEKITAHHEHLPPEWPIAGTTGYDFANLVNGLFVDRSRRARLDRTYRSFTGEERRWDAVMQEAKHLILRTSLAAEVSVLANQLHRIARSDRRTRDFSLNALRQALRDVIAAFPVYRTYIARTAGSEDERYIRWAIGRAKTYNPAADFAVYDFLQDVLTTPQEGERRAFAMKFQQVTSPAAAKGVEDTAFYRFNRLVSLNEVGGDPSIVGVSVATFHRENRRRLRDWPDALLASSTHDTKRSEDVRARIDVLSEMPTLWREMLLRWRRLNRSRHTTVDDLPAPSAEDEYLLYQTLVGTWPLERPDETALAVYRDRIVAYLIKAVREAKVRTSWANVNEPYERALQEFIAAILDARTGSLFMDDLNGAVARVARLGLFNSLSQTVLKLTSPGIPDLYQGNELWDFSLVDPDNRRPVDFPQRQALLAEVKSWEALSAEPLVERLKDLWTQPADGRAKLYLTWKTLSLRKRWPELFRKGRYIPLRATGEHAAHICAFARVHEDSAVIVAVPRLLARRLPEAQPFAPSAIDWGDTSLDLKPLAGFAGLAAGLNEVLQNRNVTVERGQTEVFVRVHEVLRELCVALLVF